MFLLSLLQVVPNSYSCWILWFHNFLSAHPNILNIYIYRISEASLVASMQSICLQCRRARFNPGVQKIPWRKEWLPTPLLLPGEFHGQRKTGRFFTNSATWEDLVDVYACIYIKHPHYYLYFFFLYWYLFFITCQGLFLCL